LNIHSGLIEMYSNRKIVGGMIDGLNNQNVCIDVIETSMSPGYVMELLQNSLGTRIQIRTRRRISTRDLVSMQGHI